MNKTLKLLIILFLVVLAGLFAGSQFLRSREIAILSKDKNPTAEPWPEKLKNPAASIKAVYATSWTAASDKQIDYLIKLATTTEINAIVIDIKDYTGHIAFETQSLLIKSIGSEEVQIKNLNKLINKLHKENIYVIARITVFQDPVLATKRPELAVKSKKTGANWKDNKGLNWVDPASLEVWNYILTVAQEADKHGFDELNFDYVRFPSDGNMQDMTFPFYDGQKPKHEIIRDFFKYLSDNLRPTGVKTSVDLFGLSTINHDDLGIGQILEDAAPYFDFVCPMVYPSHYANGFLGYANPAAYPYEVIKYSLENGQSRLSDLTATPSPLPNATIGYSVFPTPKFNQVAALRPWLQDFDLGAIYDARMVRLEKQAVYDVFCSPPSPKASADAQICSSSANGLGSKFGGWMMWDPTNVYTVAALDQKQK